jgi:hypothetical protein
MTVIIITLVLLWKIAVTKKIFQVKVRTSSLGERYHIEVRQDWEKDYQRETFQAFPDNNHLC